MICKCLRARPYYSVLVVDRVLWLFASQSVRWPVTRSWIFAFLCTVCWCLWFLGITPQNIDINDFWQRSTEKYPHFYDLSSDRSGLKFRNIPVLLCECLLQVSVRLVLYSWAWSSFRVKMIIFEGVLVTILSETAKCSAVITSLY